VNPLRPICLLAATLVALLGFAGCNQAPRSTYAEGAPLGPFTYAIMLHLPIGEDLSDEQRSAAMDFARSTLLAAGLVKPEDRLIDDTERADVLFRARVENGEIAEIASIAALPDPTPAPVYQSAASRSWVYGPPVYHSLVFGIAAYDHPYDYVHRRFAVPGPGWGIPGPGRWDRYDGRRYRGDRNSVDDSFVGPPTPTAGERNAPRVGESPRPNRRDNDDVSPRMRGPVKVGVTPSPYPRTPVSAPGRPAPSPSPPPPSHNVSSASSSRSSTSSYSSSASSSSTSSTSSSSSSSNSDRSDSSVERRNLN